MGGERERVDDDIDVDAAPDDDDANTPEPDDAQRRAARWVADLWLQ